MTPSEIKTEMTNCPWCSRGHETSAWPVKGRKECECGYTFVFSAKEDRTFETERAHKTELWRTGKGIFD